MSPTDPSMNMIALPVLGLPAVILEALDDYRQDSHDSEDALVCDKPNLTALAEIIADALVAAFSDREAAGGRPHQGGTVCPNCGQHHTPASAAALNAAARLADTVIISREGIAELAARAGLVVLPRVLGVRRVHVHIEETAGEDTRDQPSRTSLGEQHP